MLVNMVVEVIGVLTQEGYLPRLIDAQIVNALQVFGAVCVEGPKWCGKTWALLNQAESVYYVGDPSGDFQNRRLAEMEPSIALAGSEPHLVDEWQDVPPIWDAVRHEVDRSPRKGRFLLSGSSTPQRKGIMHSGTGRIGTLRMHPMSLYESGDSSGTVSMRSLFDEPLRALQTGEVSLEQLCRLIVRGGWPGNLGAPEEICGLVPASYIRQVVEQDANRVDGGHRDPYKMNLLIRSLARNESTLASNATLRRDMTQFDDDTLSDITVSDYLEVLYRLFAVYDQPAFDPNMRSSVRVGKKPKRHLADPSLAAAALGATPKRLMGDLNTLGFLFEALCERDLTIYAQACGGKLYHYRDGNGREIDAVVELPDGRWGAFEIKLGANQIDAAATSLIKMREVFGAESHARVPSILVVICGLTSFAYTRPDGVMVVPPTALRD